MIVYIIMLQQSGAEDKANAPPPAFYLTVQQIHMLNFLQENQSNLNHTQQTLLHDLRQRYFMQQQHQMQQQNLQENVTPMETEAAPTTGKRPPFLLADPNGFRAHYR